MKKITSIRKIRKIAQVRREHRGKQKSTERVAVPRSTWGRQANSDETSTYELLLRPRPFPTLY